MTIKEFTKECNNRGYGSRKDIEKWCEQHPKDEYTEDDFILVYRYCNRSYPCSHKQVMSGRFGTCTTTKHFLNDHDGNR